MPKDQARIQECIKCGYTFTSYHIQQKCNECQKIDFIVKEFVSDEIPWAHIDIAGPAFADSPWGEHPKGGTGFGVRLLVNVIENF